MWHIPCIPQDMNLPLDSGTLVASLIWGSIGFGIARYGWRQKDVLPLVDGIALMVVSYFIWSALYMSLAGAALVAALFWLKRRF